MPTARKSPAPVGSDWMTIAKDASHFITSIIVICTALSAVGVWFTGGFAPQNQVLANELKTQVGEIQITVRSIQDQLGTMPRPQDWLAIDRHFVTEDAAISALSERVTKDEIMLTHDEAVMNAYIQNSRK
jgi:hypothetical protein